MEPVNDAFAPFGKQAKAADDKLFINVMSPWQPLL